MLVRRDQQRDARQSRVPDVRMRHEFRARLGVAGLRRINQHLLQPLMEAYAWRQRSVGLIDATDLPAACGGFKKAPATIRRTAPRWAGARSSAVRAGALSATSAHTLRLWLHDYTVGVQFVPLLSWVTPANVSEGGLLAPSASGHGIGARRWSWPTWATWRPRPSDSAVNVGRWPS